MALSPFTIAAPDYIGAGWTVVVLPQRRKAPPPMGTTGRPASAPTPETVARWRRNGGNIAVRLPSTVVGVDVDAYGDKVALDTLSHLESKFGTLPPTWVSSARSIPSGIRWFRVPAGLEWSDVGPGIELVWWGHRYAVVPPSLHPEGMAYQWRDPSGASVQLLPEEHDLAELPTAWVTALSSEARPAWSAAPASHAEVQSWMEARRASLSPCPEMGRRALWPHGGESAHTRLNSVVARLVRTASDGHPGFAKAIESVTEAFVAEVTTRGRSGRRAPHEALLEVQRSVAGAVARMGQEPPPARCLCEWLEGAQS